MSLIETESLVLKSYNLAEADKIIVLLTHDQGIVRGVAKGVKRLKSKFGSGLEPFSIVRVTYKQKEGQELVAIDRADLIRSNFASAGSPEFLQKFSYLCELLISFSPPHDPNETLYRMAKACLETATADQGALLSTGVYFELWLLKLSGYLPDWSRCDRCQKVFAEADETVAITNFHFICKNCHRISSTRVVSNADRSLAKAALRISPEKFAKFSADKRSELDELSTFLKQLIARSIGRDVVGEKTLAIST